VVDCADSIVWRKREMRFGDRVLIFETSCRWRCRITAVAYDSVEEESVMIRWSRPRMGLRLGIVCFALGAVAFSMVVSGQGGQGARGGGDGRGNGGAGAQAAGGYDDHQNMMDQLKITALRPGKSGSNQVGKGFELE